MPLMPFWSLSIAYGVWQLLKWVPGIVRFLPKVFKVKQIYFLGSILLLAFCVIIGYKTYTVNITPLYKNYTTLKEAETAKALKNLTGKNDTIIRLGYSYPVTIYYSDRKVVIGQEMSDEYLASQIRDNGLTWVAGNKGDADKLLPLVKNKKALVIPTNDQEEIIKFY